MRMDLRADLRLTQQPVMTLQMQQAIRLLQCSQLEVAEAMQEEILENPILEDGQGPEEPEHEPPGTTETPIDGSVVDGVAQTEIRGDSSAIREIDWADHLESYALGPPMPGAGGGRAELPSLEATLTRPPSLHDHLAWQLRLSDLPPEQVEIGMEIIGNIDADGYFKDPPLDELAADLGADPVLCEEVLEKIQTFDPTGVGARSLAECMWLQCVAAGQDDDLCVKMIKSHLGNLENRRYQAIARDLKQPLEEVLEAAKVITELDPRPGRQYASDEPRYVTPDVYVHKVGGKYFVVLDDDGLPKLKLDASRLRALGGSPAGREYVKDRLRSAQWLVRSIQQRQRTIIRVTESILKLQHEFFDKGIAHLKPLILRDVAEDIGVHESTVSRVTTSKYVHTPQGIFELKFFFGSGVPRTGGGDLASEVVRSRIRELVAGEDPRKPLSDQKIVEMLYDGGVEVARRTVAKYRDQLGILSSAKRRQAL